MNQPFMRHPSVSQKILLMLSHDLWPDTAVGEKKKKKKFNTVQANWTSKTMKTSSNTLKIFYLSFFLLFFGGNQEVDGYQIYKRTVES